ncbi:FAD-dependent oxidoreductase [Pusillimonas sp. NJUB218]|uniref:FAD-dependent oxidoreductase n=1 Tax=Pusillimonas sp. NJUB218 TaxID=2023230 RepID=UPI000F4C840A|nr:FAD-dependent oxidoreductase [Pusillimonas sp. NJUB218]ROT45926.1 hypothetical protein CHR62_02750 [Pusillimonas sp. NJUB218]
MSDSPCSLAIPTQAWLSASGLPVGWRGRSSFTVCDTAFGAGHRFISTWSTWRSDANRSERLHYVGFCPADVNPAGDPWLFASDDEAACHEALRVAQSVYAPLPGVSRLDFEGGAVTLTLFHMPLWKALMQAEARVDHYFVDAMLATVGAQTGGYSPYGQLARMAAREASVALPAVDVSSDLGKGLKKAGFIVPTASGDLAEVCVARLRPGIFHGAHLAFPEQGRALSVAPVMVIGGGIAGAAVAWAFASRGRKVNIIDPAFSRSAQGVHAGHLAAAATPVVSRDDDYRARLTRSGVRLAWQRWQALAADARPLQTGTLGLAGDADEVDRVRAALEGGGFPAGWARWQTSLAASLAAAVPLSVPGVLFADGLLIRPGALIAALTSSPLVQRISAAGHRLERADDGGWLLRSAGDHVLAQAATVVVANAAGVVPFLQRSGLLDRAPRLRQLQAIAGQVSYFDTQRTAANPNVVIDGPGYWLPSVDGVNVAGGTYALGAETPAVTQAGHDDIIEKLGAFLSAETIQRLPDAVVGGWSGWRAVVPGRLPVVGELLGANGVWVACAYGSRGLSWAALAAEIIAASVCCEPLPLERELLMAIAPGKR